MKRFLIVVDMQNDFVSGSLGSDAAVAILPAVAKKINEFAGDIIVTHDTHNHNYLKTSEGKSLPVEHCIKGTKGWELDPRIKDALQNKNYEIVEKPTFGSLNLPKLIKERITDNDFSIELIGLCTDICVVSNAIILKAAFPENELTVDASCCAGVTKESHNASLTTMQSCQIKIINR